MITLIGNNESKRTEYFIKAVNNFDCNFEFINIENINKYISNGVAKIDPPVFKTSCIKDINLLALNYIEFLNKINKKKDTILLNSTSGIINTLDKIKCKSLLAKNNITTTKILYKDIKTYDELKENLYDKSITNIFIKPMYGSGAAGIVAYRFNHRLNDEVIYTSVAYDYDELVNTKNIHKIKDKQEIKRIINNILCYGAFIEMWIPKASFNNISYDLRVVCQFGQVDYIIARGSNSPITNLHLNNNAISLNELNLKENTINEIKKICLDTMKCFKGLNYAGIDILLEKESLKPYVIEVNGNGDLIYSDIFDKNIIYNNQVKGMIKLYESRGIRRDSE